MRWRVLVELVGSNDELQTQEVFSSGGSNDTLSARTLGLSLERAKEIMSALQHHVIPVQVEDYCQWRRVCAHCGRGRPL